MIKGYLYKLAHSPLTYIGVFGTLAVCLADFITSDGGADKTVLSRMDQFLQLDAFRKLIAIFGALPFTANFADEWKNNVTIGCVSRKGVRKYAAANVVFCAVTSLMTIFIGMTLYMGVMSLFSPFDKPDLNVERGNLYEGFPYCELLNYGPRWLYPVIEVFIFAVSCSMWSVMGLMLSAVFPNKYVAVCSPVVASYIVERFTFQLPVRFNLYSLSLSVPVIKNSVITFIYTIAVFTALSVIFGLAFGFIVKKRVRNEIA